MANLIDSEILISERQGGKYGVDVFAFSPNSNACLASDIYPCWHVFGDLFAFHRVALPKRPLSAGEVYAYLSSLKAAGLTVTRKAM